MTADSAWDDSIHPMEKRKEYETARESRASAGQCGDFWKWLAEAYPSKEQAPIVASPTKNEEGRGCVSLAHIINEPPAASYEKAGADDDFGWNDVVAEINCETRAVAARTVNAMARDKSAPPVNAPNPKQSDHGWGEIVARLNAKRAEERR
ncbi:hypothetical protein [Methylocystis sp. SB2]|uniref:hypothetical protein n=1 Tax=Methylocystis sp. (strain SB2) TaxID=743836 RepID=UPI00041425BC|nr:hypothetical protein [Methylocystis sp. SB2]ULO25114.1 hypothetical protein LNB28_06920 [Methylocystis sp. SB2]